MYNRIETLMWLDGQEVKFKVLESDFEVTEGQKYLIAEAVDQADEDVMIQVSGDESLQDGLIIKGTYVPGQGNWGVQFFEIISIDNVGAEYAALIGG